MPKATAEYLTANAQREPSGRKVEETKAHAEAVETKSCVALPASGAAAYLRRLPHTRAESKSLDVLVLVYYTTLDRVTVKTVYLHYLMVGGVGGVRS